VSYRCLKCLNYVLNYLKENEIRVKNDRDKYLKLLEKYPFIDNERFLTIKNKIQEIVEYVKNKNIDENQLTIKKSSLNDKNKKIEYKLKVKEDLKKPLYLNSKKTLENPKKPLYLNSKKTLSKDKSQKPLDSIKKKLVKKRKNKKKFLKKIIKSKSLDYVKSKTPKNKPKKRYIIQKSKINSVKAITKPQQKNNIEVKKLKKNNIEEEKLKKINAYSKKPKNEFFEEIDDSYDNGQLKWY
jgi:hypothetical protein